MKLERAKDLTTLDGEEWAKDYEKQMMEDAWWMMCAQEAAVADEVCTGRQQHKRLSSASCWVRRRKSNEDHMEHGIWVRPPPST